MAFCSAAIMFRSADVVVGIGVTLHWHEWSRLAECLNLHGLHQGAGRASRALKARKRLQQTRSEQLGSTLGHFRATTSLRVAHRSACSITTHTALIVHGVNRLDPCNPSYTIRMPKMGSWSAFLTRSRISYQTRTILLRRSAMVCAHLRRLGSCSAKPYIEVLCWRWPHASALLTTFLRTTTLVDTHIN